MSYLQALHYIKTWIQMPMKEALKSIDALRWTFSADQHFDLESAFREMWLQYANRQIKNRVMKILLLYNYWHPFSGKDNEFTFDLGKPTHHQMSAGNIVRGFLKSKQTTQTQKLIQQALALSVEDPQRIILLRRIIKTISPDDSPDDWVWLTNNLGRTLLSQIQGNYEENIEAAIYELERALIVARREEYYSNLVNIYSNLSMAYILRSVGNRRENIERSLELASRAFAYWENSKLPSQLRGENLASRISFDLEYREMRRLLLNNLGEVHRQRMAGVIVDNIEASIAYFEKAIEDFKWLQETFEDPTIAQAPMSGWAEVLNNLMLSYVQRLKGDKADNIERAIEYGELAVEIWRKLETGERRAEFNPAPVLKSHMGTTFNNLGGAYAHRLKGDISKNLQKAITFLTEAVEIRSMYSTPHQYAESLNNLAATMLNQQAPGPRYRRLAHAKKMLNESLDVFHKVGLVSETIFPRINLAQINLELADTYSGEDRESHIQMAIDELLVAEAIVIPDPHPIQYGEILKGLGDAYAKHSPYKSAIETSEQYYERAAKVYSSGHMPFEEFQVWIRMGALYFGIQDWSRALDAYKTAIDLSDHISSTIFTESGQQSFISWTSEAYTNASYCLLQQENYTSSLLLLERGKARILSQVLSLDELGKRLPKEKQGEFHSLRAEMQGLVTEYRLPRHTPGRRSTSMLSDEIKKRDIRIKDLLKDADISEIFASLTTPLELSEIVQLLPSGEALVIPIVTNHGGAILFITSGTEKITRQDIVRLTLTQTDIENDLLIGTKEDPGLLSLHLDRDLQVSQRAQALRQFGQKLWNKIAGPIYEWASTHNVTRIIISPHGNLQIIPFHAAWRLRNSKLRFLIDDFELIYIPSIYGLSVVKSRSKNRTKKSGSQSDALVGGISVSWHGNLPSVPSEVKAISSLFNVKPYLNEHLTESILFEQAKSADYIHLACHGGYAWKGDILSSAIYLAEDKPLYLSTIVDRLRLHNAQLVVLSACESGLVDIGELQNEFIGLPFGFMSAGASTVVGSLWSVDDQSTSLLMSRFYELLLDSTKNRTPSQALREAQIWLKELSYDDFNRLVINERKVSETEIGEYEQQVKMRNPFSNPYYWAAFVCIGA